MVVDAVNYLIVIFAALRKKMKLIPSAARASESSDTWREIPPMRKEYKLSQENTPIRGFFIDPPFIFIKIKEISNKELRIFIAYCKSIIYM